MYIYLDVTIITEGKLFMIRVMYSISCLIERNKESDVFYSIRVHC